MMTWPPTEDDLDCGDTVVPDLLYNMFAWICSSDAEYSNKRVCGVSAEVRRLVLSLAQDLIHCVSRGRIKTPKHVTLPLTVKSLTGNAELVTILNRFGHALSYSQIEELETALAEKERAKEQHGIIVPSACSMGVPAVFCWDNNDLLEETLSGTRKRFVHDLRQSSFSAENAFLNIQLTSFTGIPLSYRYYLPYILYYIIYVCRLFDHIFYFLLGKGTTHCTNGIVIQRKPLTCAPPLEMAAQELRPKRSRTLTYIPTDVLPFHSGPRQGPSPFDIGVHDVITSNPDVSAYARSIDFGWMLCRQPIEDNLFPFASDQSQVIPAWTGFNIKLRQEDVPRESSIDYCQVIDASPTEIPTVYTLLQRSLLIADQLGQQNAIIVFDQAIYAKALEVIWQNQITFQRLVVRMGSFHTICSFLAAIGKRFGDAGLGDVVTESEIVGSGSVAAVLEGRHYNRALRTHKVSSLEVGHYSKRRCASRI